MGSGKSTIGRLLSRKLGVTFVDTDDEIERRSGRRISTIFAEDGEAGFRALEARVVTDVLASYDGVVSLGGGAVMTEAIRTALAGHRVIYLKLSAEAGFARVASSDRPLLADPDPAGRYAALLQQREPTYRSVAAFEVAADREPHVVIDDIRAQLELENRRGSHRVEE
ncbi:shikimate kinase [Gordonia sp. (in: high G+C Gram-positive bacteria)]|uniref:shikimate kinase n=1 Tax=Gordonia sp. (in: high G+C Gram-positive bacteria) TaxID=84139 RepID=UPI003C706E43